MEADSTFTIKMGHGILLVDATSLVPISAHLQSLAKYSNTKRSGCGVKVVYVHLDLINSKDWKYFYLHHFHVIILPVLSILSYSIIINLYTIQ